MLLAKSFEVRLVWIVLFHRSIVKSWSRLFFKGNLCIVVYTSFFLALLLNIYACSTQLSAFLQGCQAPGGRRKTIGVRQTKLCTVFVKTYNNIPLTTSTYLSVHIQYIFHVSSYLASSSCFSLAFRLAFFPCVFANLALASDSISNSSAEKIQALD